MEILIVQTAFLGDLLLSIPLIKNVKLLYPGSKLTLVCRKGLGILFQDLGLVDRFFEVEKGSSASYAEVKNHLQTKKWDLVLCPHESLRSALLVQGLTAETKVGFSRWWNWSVFHKRVRRDLALPDALRQLELLSPLNKDFFLRFEDYRKTADAQNPKERDGLVDFRKKHIPEWASMQIEIPASLFEKYSGLEQSLFENMAFIFPGSVWATKQWTTSGFIELAQQLQDSGFEVVWMGSPQERGLGQYLQEHVPSTRSYVGNFSLTETIMALSRGRLLVTNDSGSMHMGSMVGIPTVALFGPTTLDIGYRPWQTHAFVVQKGLECRPCGKHGHMKCPLGHHHCMKLITSKEVFQATKKLLKT